MALSLVPATGAVLDHVLRDTYPVWGGGLSFDAYVRYQRALRRTPWGEAHTERVVLLDGSRPLASAVRHDLTARIDGRIRRVLGVGSVFTPRELRGRGAGSAMIAHLVDAANTEGYEFVLLFSEIGPGFYERLDFVPVPFEQAQLAVRLKGGAPAMLVRAGDDRDLAQIAELGVARAAAARLALDRTEDYIRHAVARRRLLAGLGPAGLRHAEFLVAEEGHMAVAYVVCTAVHGRWSIEEAGDRDPSGARIGAMLQVMLAREPSLRPPVITAWWPHALAPPQIDVLGRRATDEVLMLRPLRDRTLPMPPLGASDVVLWRSDLF
jgi:predicted N-acetyltransferase YhbS